MTMPSPYSSSERYVQARAGQIDAADGSARMIASTIMAGAWRFLAAQSMVVVGSWDGQRLAWPTLIVGQSGFVGTPDGARLRFDMSKAAADPSDPLWANLQRSGRMSALAIDLATRRRLRINGHIEPLPSASLACGDFALLVDQAYGNCPKYIQRRVLRASRPLAPTQPAQYTTSLSDEHRAIVANADTLFVASVHPKLGTDVSHRGGKPGFVAIESASRLRIPDYAGNGMFNTLGNIEASGIAGLLFIDFAGNRQLQVSGDARIDWSAQGDGAQRSWLVDICQVRASALPEGTHWEYVDASPFNPDIASRFTA